MPVTGIVRPPVPADTYELLSEARALVAAGADQAAAIDFVYTVAARLGLRVRHDQHELHPAPEKEAAPEVAAAPEEAALEEAAPEEEAALEEAAPEEEAAAQAAAE